jgi:hypothetical protein
VAQELRSDPRFDGLPILICSGDLVALKQIADDLDEKRNIRTLAKPFSIDELTQSVDELLADAVAS